ncbi:uncharacterized protein TRIADDRAFT_55409 [Trichoplax adhaerens]|uniref:E3 ubiquitin-protein ligase PDZRN3 n=1 Tax=Trichoplax adhaerens TaxID=10228 RepID=B3RUT8_TRIAD|nr:hypothetical protein TRIADDRAFT_55409 [Trichoplax adhaerens]EDV25881.1 hypothetical protein TRIADDRAFT_55409 [Trichoplax adhaerens]|eukprot:XP_002111914.1 hypothetical protein TRIADDRAFT_55409 [Trichoplax adhaerens]
MGFDPDLFLDRIYPYMICKLCTLVADEPMVTSCKHVFCMQCIQSWLAREDSTKAYKLTSDGPIKQCPAAHCSRWLSAQALKKAINLRAVLNKLQLSCPYKSLGCRRTLQVENVRSHLHSCNYRYNFYQKKKKDSVKIHRIHADDDEERAINHRHYQQEENPHSFKRYTAQRSRSYGDKSRHDVQYLRPLNGQQIDAIHYPVQDSGHAYFTSLVDFNKQHQIDFKLLRQKVAEQQITIWSQENQIATLNDTMKLLKQGLVYRPSIPVNNDHEKAGLKPSYSPTEVSEVVISLLLVKENNSFGFSVKGFDAHQPTGVYVSKIADGTLAASRLAIYDRILQVNGKDITNLTQDQAARKISNAVEPINLLIARKIARHPNERSSSRRKKRCHKPLLAKNDHRIQNKCITQSSQTDNLIDSRRYRNPEMQDTDDRSPPYPITDHDRAKVADMKSLSSSSSSLNQNGRYSLDDNRFYDNIVSAGSEAQNDSFNDKLRKLNLSLNSKKLHNPSFKGNQSLPRNKKKSKDPLGIKSIRNDGKNLLQNQDCSSKMTKSHSLELLSLRNYHLSNSSHKASKVSQQMKRFSGSVLCQTNIHTSSCSVPAQIAFNSETDSHLVSQDDDESGLKYHNNSDVVLLPSIKKHMEDGPTLEWESEIDFNENLVTNDNFSYQYEERLTNSNDVDDESDIPNDDKSNSIYSNLKSPSSREYDDHKINTEKIDANTSNKTTSDSDLADYYTEFKDNRHQFMHSYSEMNISQLPEHSTIESKLSAISLNGSMKGVKVNHIRFDEDNDNVKLYKTWSTSRGKIGKHYYQDPVFVVNDWQEYHNHVAKYFDQYHQSNYDNLQCDKASIKTA